MCTPAHAALSSAVPTCTRLVCVRTATYAVRQLPVQKCCRPAMPRACQLCSPPPTSVKPPSPGRLSSVPAVPSHPPAAPWLCWGSPRQLRLLRSGLAFQRYLFLWRGSPQTHTPSVSANLLRALGTGDCLLGNFKPSWTLLIWNEFTGLNFWQVFSLSLTVLLCGLDLRPLLTLTWIHVGLTLMTYWCASCPHAFNTRGRQACLRTWRHMLKKPPTPTKRPSHIWHVLEPFYISLPFMAHSVFEFNSPKPVTVLKSLKHRHNHKLPTLQKPQ